MLSKVDRWVELSANFNIHNNIYGLSRSIIAFALLITLAFNPTDVLFSSHTSLEPAFIPGPIRFSIFHLLNSDLILAKSISLIILFAVVIGWRPRWTGILHWWIAFSFFASCPIVDGGDQIGAILSFFFIPFTLTDNRKWHWSVPYQTGNFYSANICHLFYLCIRIQASIIYFFAAAEKLAVPEWKNGTVIYYWLNHSTFGMNEGFRFFVDPIIENPVVAIITWSVLILEVLLSMALIAPRNLRKILLPAGIGFHFLIFIFHGLFTFFFYMSALLIMYLRPIELPYKLIWKEHSLRIRSKKLSG